MLERFKENTRKNLELKDAYVKLKNERENFYKLQAEVLEEYETNKDKGFIEH